VPDRKAVFLDRDGVVNRLVYRPDFGILDSPVHPRELLLLPGVPAAIAALNQAGFAVLVVTNQPGIAKATLPSAELEKLHRLMRVQLAASGGRLDGIYVCPHHPHGVIPALAVVCDCRKPAAGLLLRAAEELELDLRSSYMIGDGDIDVMAGRAVGATTFLIANLKPCLVELLDARDTWPDQIVPDLPTAVKSILTRAAETRVPALPPRTQNDRSVMSSGAYVETYLRDARASMDRIDRGAVRAVLDELVALKRRGGRLFVAHMGAAAGRTAHVGTGFEQLDVVESVVPANPNDHQGCVDLGSCTGPSLASWLVRSGLSRGDLLLVICTDGQRSLQHGPDIHSAIRHVKRRGGQVCAILGGQARAVLAHFDASVMVPGLDQSGGSEPGEARPGLFALFGLLASHPEIGRIPLAPEHSDKSAALL
jgi:D-glycero-D-manno-heptose 1,7-bisphosphate phosphatase